MGRWGGGGGEGLEGWAGGGIYNGRTVDRSKVFSRYINISNRQKKKMLGEEGGGEHLKYIQFSLE